MSRFNFKVAVNISALCAVIRPRRLVSNSATAAISGATFDHIFHAVAVKDFDTAVLLWEKKLQNHHTESEFARGEQSENIFAAMISYAKTIRPFKARDLANLLCDREQYTLVPASLLRAYCSSDSITYVEAMLLKWLSCQPDSFRDEQLNKVLSHLQKNVKANMFEKIIASQNSEKMFKSEPITLHEWLAVSKFYSIRGSWGMCLDILSYIEKENQQQQSIDSSSPCRSMYHSAWPLLARKDVVSGVYLATIKSLTAGGKLQLSQQITRKALAHFASSSNSKGAVSPQTIELLGYAAGTLPLDRAGYEHLMHYLQQAIENEKKSTADEEPRNPSQVVNIVDIVNNLLSVIQSVVTATPSPTAETLEACQICIGSVVQVLCKNGYVNVAKSLMNHLCNSPQLVAVVPTTSYIDIIECLSNAQLLSEAEMYYARMFKLNPNQQIPHCAARTIDEKKDYQCVGSSNSCNDRFSTVSMGKKQPSIASALAICYHHICNGYLKSGQYVVLANFMSKAFT